MTAFSAAASFAPANSSTGAAREIVRAIAKTSTSGNGEGQRRFSANRAASMASERSPGVAGYSRTLSKRTGSYHSQVLTRFTKVHRGPPSTNSNSAVRLNNGALSFAGEMANEHHFERRWPRPGAKNVPRQKMTQFICLLLFLVLEFVRRDRTGC